MLLLYHSYHLPVWNSRFDTAQLQPCGSVMELEGTPLEHDGLGEPRCQPASVHRFSLNPALISLPHFVALMLKFHAGGKSRSGEKGLWVFQGAGVKNSESSMCIQHSAVFCSIWWLKSKRQFFHSCNDTDKRMVAVLLLQNFFSLQMTGKIIIKKICNECKIEIRLEWLFFHYHICKSQMSTYSWNMLDQWS